MPNWPGQLVDMEELERLSAQENGLVVNVSGGPGALAADITDERKPGETDEQYQARIGGFPGQEVDTDSGLGVSDLVAGASEEDVLAAQRRKNSSGLTNAEVLQMVGKLPES